MIITIRHQLEKTYHKFDVADPHSLTSVEVWAICFEMGVTALLINGKYYETK